jgi:hypothetical protein
VLDLCARDAAGVLDRSAWEARIDEAARPAGAFSRWRYAASLVAGGMETRPT